MFAFLAPPAGPHDLSDADSETDTSSTFSGPSRVGRHDCRRCGGSGGGNLYVSAWTQTEHVAAEAGEGSGYGDAALAARQEDPQIHAARAACLSISASKVTADPGNPITTTAYTPALASALKVVSAIQNPQPPPMFSVATTTATAASPPPPDLYPKREASIEKCRDALTLMATAHQNVRAKMSLLESSTLPAVPQAPGKRAQAPVEEKAPPGIDDIACVAEEQGKAKGAEVGKKRARELEKSAKLEEKRIRDAEKAHAKLLKAQEKEIRREEKKRRKQERKEDASSIFTENTEKKKRQNPLGNFLWKISQTRPSRGGGGKEGHSANAPDIRVRDTHLRSASEPHDVFPKEDAHNATGPPTTVDEMAEWRGASVGAGSGDRSSVGSRFVERL